MNAKQLYISLGLGTYFQLTIHERINLRQNRNGLNINGLFCTCLNNFWLHSNRFALDHPKINNGIYHHIGRNHSKYPSFK